MSGPEETRGFFMPKIKPNHEDCMRLALRLAARGGIHTRPNPRVGAVVVNQGRVVGQGYHKKPGGPHAELEALRKASGRTRGGTLYVTMEPCCHIDKRTPPCVGAIIEAGISTLVYAMEDPNPKVCGQGARALREAGLEVIGPILESEARELNEVYIKNITTGLPFVTLKLAMSLDGRIATASGESRGLSSSDSQKEVHRMRMESEAILVGAGTVIADDPELTVRLVDNPEQRQPTRFVVDTALRSPLDRKIWDQTKAKTILATTSQADRSKLEELDRRGIEVWIIDFDASGRVDLGKLMHRLGLQEYYTLLVEGGGEIAASMLKAGLVDRIAFFYTPCLIGSEGIPACGALGTSSLKDSIMIKKMKSEAVGQDILIQGGWEH